MKTIPLTAGYEAIVDDEDFERVSRLTWYAHISRRKNGSIHTVYTRHDKMVKRKRTRVYLHRFIAGIENPKVQVDHANNNGLDNRRENLRVCGQSQNNANMRKPRHNTSGFKGVTWFAARGKWVAQIVVRGQHKTLGYFTSREAAAKAYNDAALAGFGKFAKVNHL